MSSVENRQPAGSLKISKNVIETIVRTSAREIGGVASLPEEQKNGGRVFPRNFGKKAVRVSLTDDFAEIDLYVNLEAGARIPDVCAAVQNNVKDNVQTMTGIAVSKVNVTVSGVVFPSSAS